MWCFECSFCDLYFIGVHTFLKHIVVEWCCLMGSLVWSYQLQKWHLEPFWFACLTITHFSCTILQTILFWHFGWLELGSSAGCLVHVLLSNSRICLRSGKLIILANNCPPLRKSEIEYYAMLAKVSVHHFHGSKIIVILSGQYFSSSLPPLDYSMMIGIMCIYTCHCPSVFQTMLISALPAASTTECAASVSLTQVCFPWTATLFRWLGVPICKQTTANSFVLQVTRTSSAPPLAPSEQRRGASFAYP